MANTLPHVNQGSVTLPTGYVIDCQSFSLREMQATEDVTPFGANTYSRTIGDGTPNISGTVSGFAICGNSTNQPGFGKAASTSAPIGDMGATATFAVGSGTAASTSSTCNLSGNVVIQDISLSVSRIRAGVPVTLSWVGAGEFTTTWV